MPPPAHETSAADPSLPVLASTYPDFKDTPDNSLNRTGNETGGDLTLAPQTALASNSPSDDTAAVTTVHVTSEPDTVHPKHNQIPGTDTSANQAAHWTTWVFGIWLTGTVAMSGAFIFTSRSLAHRFRQARPVTDTDVLALFDGFCRRMHVRTTPSIYECDRVTSPVLHGCFRPCLLLPSGFVRRLPSSDLGYVFLHELAHVKRCDLPVNWLLALLQLAHWFNPLVWFAFARWRTEREMACDALALETAGDGHNQAYGQTILRILENLVPQTRSPNLVGILESKRHLRQRIALIANHIPRRRVSILPLFLLSALCVVGLSDAQESSPANLREQSSITDINTTLSPDAHFLFGVPNTHTIRLRVLGLDGTPVKADVMIIPPDDPFSILPLKRLTWHGVTDDSGRIGWDDVPPGTHSISVNATGYILREFPITVPLDCDELKVWLKRNPGLPPTLISVHATDEESGLPLEDFEVWPIDSASDYTDTCLLGTQGHLSALLPPPSSRRWPPLDYVAIEVRSPGYQPWRSDQSMTFSSARPIAVKLQRRTTATEALALPLPANAFALEGEKLRHMETLAQQVCALLADGDADAFSRATSPTADDWPDLPHDAITMNRTAQFDSFGLSRDKNLKSMRSEVATSARIFIALANDIGLRPGLFNFRIKSLQAAGQRNSVKTIGQQRITVPVYSGVKLVLTAEPIKENIHPEAQRLSGDYTIDLDSEIFMLPAAVKLTTGLRWSGLPPGVGSDRLRHEIAIARTIMQREGSRRPLSNADDAALIDYGEAFAYLLRTRDIAGFINAPCQAKPSTTKRLHAYPHRMLTACFKDYAGGLPRMRTTSSRNLPKQRSTPQNP
ncbi:hypothetical protein Ga0100231_007230 [Opitutaceae bacterium TAV4]|nr:hypothetical protein Ga0100231_007230 [Opitutaceae bacterium TAV4]